MFELGLWKVSRLFSVKYCQNINIGGKIFKGQHYGCPAPPHHHQERKSSFDIFVTYLNLCHSWGALRGGICCPSFWGWAPFLVGSKNFQHFDPREVLETQPTPFLNQLSALEPILFYQDSPFKSVRELFQESCTCAHLVKRFFQTITGVF